MIHLIHKDFPFDNITKGRIICNFLYSYIKLKKIPISNIEINKIVCNDLSIIDIYDLKYRSANIDLPGIVVDFGDFYRLIDGRHRLKKLKDNNIDKMKCHILTKEECLKYYRP